MKIWVMLLLKVKRKKGRAVHSREGCMQLNEIGSWAVLGLGSEEKRRKKKVMQRSYLTFGG